MPLPWPFDRELVWVDTGAQDEYRNAQRSVANEFEVALCKDITTIIRRRVRKAKLAVIAMYSSEVSRLVSALKGIVPQDDIEAVDAFAGRGPGRGGAVGTDAASGVARKRGWRSGRSRWGRRSSRSPTERPASRSRNHRRPTRPCPSWPRQTPNRRRRSPSPVAGRGRRSR